jgi:hypothetical protein
MLVAESSPQSALRFASNAAFDPLWNINASAFYRSFIRSYYAEGKLSDTEASNGLVGR